MKLYTCFACLAAGASAVIARPIDTFDSKEGIGVDTGQIIGLPPPASARDTDAAWDRPKADDRSRVVPRESRATRAAAGQRATRAAAAGQ